MGASVPSAHKGPGVGDGIVRFGWGFGNAAGAAREVAGADFRGVGATAVREFAIADQSAEVVRGIAGPSSGVDQGEQLVGLVLQFRVELIGRKLPDLRLRLGAGVSVDDFSALTPKVREGSKVRRFGGAFHGHHMD